MNKQFFPPRTESNPTIYAYEDTNPQYKGMLKVGFTTVDAKTRVAQQYPIVKPGALPYRIVLEEPAMRSNGSVFTDHDIHRYLRNHGIKNPDGEWFKCIVRDVKNAILAIKIGKEIEDNRTLDFRMRPEQLQAIEKTAAYFHSYKNENPRKTPHFL